MESADRVELTYSPPCYPSGVFTNGELALNEVDVFGFDYDYTLASYTAQIQPLIYRLAVEHLTSRLGYPDFLLKLRYDPHFAIRGLHYDLKLGHIMKLDYLYNIQKDAIFFGRQPVSQSEVLERYGSFHLRRNYVEQNCKQMVDVFCLPEAGLLADVIQEFSDREISFDPSYVFQDVCSSISEVHRSGALHRTIVDDFSMYLRRTDSMVPFLQKLRDGGKKTFLLTNSPYPFVNAGMDYLTHDRLPEGARSWRDLFDLVLTASKKPDFFRTDRPFRRVVPHHLVGDDPSAVRTMWETVDRFEEGAVYSEGSLRHLNKMKPEWNDRVLYFGDHVLADLKEPAVAGGWKTGVIIHELEREIRIMNSHDYRTNLFELINCHHLLRRTTVAHANAVELNKRAKRAKEKQREHASVEHASVEYASVEHASVEHASVEHASVEHASVEHASVEHAGVEHASVEHASVEHASAGTQKQEEQQATVSSEQSEKTNDDDDVATLEQRWRELDDRRRTAKRALKRCFNVNFGSLHRTYGHPSMFSHLMLRFAHIYTSKIDNLMHYPLDFTFYPERFYLPHDVRVLIHDPSEGLLGAPPHLPHDHRLDAHDTLHGHSRARKISAQHVLASQQSTLSPVAEPMSLAEELKEKEY
jgi:HAD superfamily 5'-nucleotidase-like hydrolase